MAKYYIGLMSGTSLDGIDAVVVDFSASTNNISATHYIHLPSKLKQDIEKLCVSGNNEIDLMGQVDARLGEVFAQSVSTLIEKAGLNPEDIIAIGSHGQTIRHRPDLDPAFTLQIGNPAIISQRTGITTVADFRRADMAVGGQGAPLVPCFHRAVFHSPKKNRVIVNIGGIANITVLPADTSRDVLGFDTGPGNVLLNAHINRTLGKAFDENGEWAKTGATDEKLLQLLLKDNYFKRSPPKSTGREMFSLEWADMTMKKNNLNLPPKALQSTLSELTAASIAGAIESFAPDTEEIYVCGGGVHNLDLMDRLKRCIQPRTLGTTEILGISPDYVEAATFAWLAKGALEGINTNIPSVTGAQKPVVLGAIYPGQNFSAIKS